MSGKELFLNIRSIIESNGESELFHKAFLKPFEVALKTWRTENEPDKMGFLPYGLKQVIKKDIDFNQFNLGDFEDIDEREISHNTDFSNL